MTMVKRNSRCKGARAIILKVSYAAVIYLTWLERNNHIFHNRVVAKEAIIYQVKLDLSIKVQGNRRLVDQFGSYYR